MTFTIEHFLLSLLILIPVTIVLVTLYFLGLLLFHSYCKMDDVPDRHIVKTMIQDALKEERNRTYSNSSNALKSENKLKSTKGGRK